MYSIIEIGFWVLAVLRGGILMIPLSSVAIVYNLTLFLLQLDFNDTHGEFITMFKIGKWLHVVFYVLVDIVLIVSVLLFSEFF